MLIRDATLADGRRRDVRIEDERIANVTATGTICARWERTGG